MRRRRALWVYAAIARFIEGKASWCLPGLRDARPTGDDEAPLLAHRELGMEIESSL
jgi:hypothetical protein